MADFISMGGPSTYCSSSIEPSFEIIACKITVPDTCALFAIGGYCGVTLLTRDAACTVRSTRTRGAAFDGGGGGTAEEYSPFACRVFAAASFSGDRVLGFSDLSDQAGNLRRT